MLVIVDDGDDGEAMERGAAIQEGSAWHAEQASNVLQWSAE